MLRRADHQLWRWLLPGMEKLISKSGMGVNFEQQLALKSTGE